MSTCAAGRDGLRVVETGFRATFVERRGLRAGHFTALSGHADAYSPLEGEALISVGGMITNGPPPFFNCPWLKTSMTPSEMITVAAAIQRLIPLSWDDSVSEPV
jgi:hypothetical protein